MPFSNQPTSPSFPQLNHPSQEEPPVLAARSMSDDTSATAFAALDIAIRRASEKVIVSMQGQLTAASSAEINHLLADLIRDQGNRHLVIDVDELTEVDGHGLEVLLEAKRLALHCGATLTVRNPSEAVRQVLEARWPTPA